ncbi:hypothetical protein SAMN05421788_106364 [Filimonas lacunae]|uniref:Uncharacterized protein n=1 Tax=Filimonas lacunae TaxID=477680 RepID=A0A173MFN7_9BACT|nr:hypothetical protein FLA_2315 [Filimonas lacunae]SIT25709.1 hypothetical protein SAMN05421788_106364 [Filimonas lacunae]
MQKGRKNDVAGCHFFTSTFTGRKNRHGNLLCYHHLHITNAGIYNNNVSGGLEQVQKIYADLLKQK